LLAGLALTLSAILLARQRITAAEEEIHRKVAPVDIVVPSVPIPAGGMFTEQNLAKKPIPASGAGARNVPASEFELLIGARSKTALTAGEPVLWTDVEEPFATDRFSQTIPGGRRAFTLEATISSSFAGLIRPGDIVDLLCEAESGKGTRFWVHAVPVMSVDRQFGRVPSKEEHPDVSTVTISVTPAEGRLLAIALQQGRIHWFLRNPEESAKSIATARPGEGRPVGTIEIWKGGIRELDLPFPMGDSG
jgi:Flp pilus assembly protein CpaB